MLRQSSKSPCSVVVTPTAHSAFWLVALAALGCRHAPAPAAQGVGSADRAAVLAVVAESLWVRAGSPQAFPHGGGSRKRLADYSGAKCTGAADRNQRPSGAAPGLV